MESVHGRAHRVSARAWDLESANAGHMHTSEVVLTLGMLKAGPPGAAGHREMHTPGPWQRAWCPGARP